MANDLLRQARLRLPSPAGHPGRRMSRQELAEAVNSAVFERTRRICALDGHYIGRLERGARRWPNADYRAGFRAVLGVQNDADLGFYRTRRNGDDGVAGSGRVTLDMRLVITAGTAVVVLPVRQPALSALLEGNWRAEARA